MEAAENGVLSLGEIFSNKAQLSDLDHLPEGPWVPSDAREAQWINGKSVTVQGRAWQDKPVGVLQCRASLLHKQHKQEYVAMCIRSI